MKKPVTIILVAVVALVGMAGIYAVANKDKAQPDTTTEHVHADGEVHTHQAGTPAQSSEVAAQEVTITYADNGYSPSTVTVKTGGKVTVKNTSNRVMQFDSDPHPSHTDNRELNAENIAPGKSETFIVTRTGTFGYHNHLNESETGTIVVQE